MHKPTAFEIDAILDTLEGTLSLINNAEGPVADAILRDIAKWEAEFEKAVNA